MWAPRDPFFAPIGNRIPAAADQAYHLFFTSCEGLVVTAIFFVRREWMLCGVIFACVATNPGGGLAGTPARNPNPVTTVFPLQVKALLPLASGNWVGFGDTDHDGRREVVFSGRNPQGSCCYYQIFEHQGNNVYTQQYLGAQLYVRGVDDLDQDGKAEIIGQIGNQVQVYEASDAASSPSILIWSSLPFSTTLGRFAFGDTDRDGHREIIYGVPGSGTVAIFESTGDNTFQTFLFSTGAGGVDDFAIGDLDQDGLVEIACTKEGASLLKIFESPANDTWIQTFSSPTVSHPSQIEGGHDVDGDGKPDFFIGGSGSVGGVSSYRTVVYRPTGDNQFAPVDTFEVTDGSSGALANCLGDLDGLGVEEYVVNSSIGLWVFRPTSPGNWALVGQVPDPDGGSHYGVFASDVNENGRTEVFWATGAVTRNTLVLEYSSGVSDATPSTFPRAARLSIAPNPCHLEATIRIPDTAVGGATLAVFDVGGRLLDRRPIPEGLHRIVPWHAQHFTSGIYYLRVEGADAAPIAVGRAVVISK